MSCKINLCVINKDAPEEIWEQVLTSCLMRNRQYLYWENFSFSILGSYKVKKMWQTAFVYEVKLTVIFSCVATYERRYILCFTHGKQLYKIDLYWIRFSALEQCKFNIHHLPEFNSLYERLQHTEWEPWCAVSPNQGTLSSCIQYNTLCISIWF